jgi:hypothetical protein
LKALHLYATYQNGHIFAAQQTAKHIQSLQESSANMDLTDVSEIEESNVIYI